MGNIMQIWSKTWNFKNQNSSSDSQLTPTFISWLEKAWVGNMISCVIWPSINSWRHHNGLRTQIFNLHIMTSAYFCKIDCISVNIDQFSFKFWYVLPGNILYKCSYHDISFWQWHHGVFLRLKEACQFFTFCVYSLWDMTFSQNLILHPVFCEQYLRRFSFVYAELWVCCSWDNKLSQVCPLFFDQMPGSCSYFNYKVGFVHSIFRLRVISMGNVLVYR